MSALTIKEKKSYICVHAKCMNRDDLLDIGKTIQRYNHKKSLKSNADGLRINLDRINDDPMIETLYAQISHKVNRNDS